MNVPKMNKPTTGLTLLLSAMYSVTAPAALPTRLSDKAVAVIPFELATFCTEVSLQSCPQGLTEVRTSVSCAYGGSVSIELASDDGVYVDSVICNGQELSDPAIDWYYGETGEGFAPPVSLVQLESCVPSNPPGSSPTSSQVADVFVYKPSGETADGGLYLCGQDGDGSCLEDNTGFIDVTFCLALDDEGTPVQTETVEIPACDPDYCPNGDSTDKSRLLIEVTEVAFDAQGNPTQVIRPADEAACLCNVDGTTPPALQECDPGAAAGTPSACETGDEDGPAQTLLNEEISAEYYCWEAGNDKFCYKFPQYMDPM